MSDRLHAVMPLGLFGVVADQDAFERLRGEILALAGAIAEDERPAIAKYLRGGAIILALMTYSWDVVDGVAVSQRKLGQILRPGPVCGRFAVPGGCGINTDGTYYWRSDTADYVEHYGTGLPEDFLRHGRALGWVARPMDPEDVLAVDRYLREHVRELGPPMDPEDVLAYERYLMENAPRSGPSHDE